ncbi:MAG: hypothetical protein AAFR41_12570 [Pseudomonadota bacterium]
MADTTRPDDNLDVFLFAERPEGEAIDAAHRDWMNAQTQATLDRIEAGEMTFKTLEEIRAKFGLDAR